MEHMSKALTAKRRVVRGPDGKVSHSEAVH
jgi:hypothetical protein